METVLLSQLTMVPLLLYKNIINKISKLNFFKLDNLTCPVCNKTFQNYGELVDHTTSHARVRLSMKKARFKPFTCLTCLKVTTINIFV